jgi:hypothetical protein
VETPIARARNAILSRHPQQEAAWRFGHLRRPSRIKVAGCGGKSGGKFEPLLAGDSFGGSKS